MKFKNYIETESGIKDTSTSPGTSGQLLSSTVAGTSWIDQSAVHSGSSEVVDIQVKNISSGNGGVSLSKGDPVYIYGSVGASPKLYVDLADADSTATNNLGDNKMPCVGLLDQDLAPNGEGTATVVGKLRNLITSPIDGATPSENDTVYVKSGGGLTLTKPTGSTNLIQNVGQVGRVSTSADGNIVVAALLRSNDVPNLPEGRIWVGDGNTIVSDTVYLDEANGYMGIGTTNPTNLLTLESSSFDPYPGIDIKSTNTYPGGKIRFLDSSESEVSTIESWSNPSISYLKLHYGTTTAFSSTLTLDDGFLYLSTAGSEKMRIKSNGDVGIGTTNPNSKLQVEGEIDANGGDGYRINGKPWAVENSNILRLGDWDGEVFSTSIFDENSIETLRVVDKGVIISSNVSKSTGYGTAANLLVGGDKFSPYGEGVLTLLNNEPNSTAGMKTGSVQFAMKDDAVDGYVSSSITGSINLPAGSGGSGGGILDFNTSLGQTGSPLQTRMRINQIGNVGIGTTSPDAKLEVSSSSGGVLRLTSSDTSVATGESIGRVEFKSNDASTGGNNVMGFVDCLATNAGSTYALTFGTGNAAAATEKMRINQSGNVGIGTTSLTTISSTSTTLSLGSTSTTTSGGIAFQANSVVKAYNYVANNYLINQTVSGIGQIFYGAGSEQMRIHNTTGNVGIGTTNPNAKLEVAGSTRITGSGLDVGYGNNGTNYVQVGFGRTTNGFALIDLIGDDFYDDYGFRILRNNGGPNTDTDILHRGTGDLDLKTIDAGDIGFHTTSIQRMIVKSNGNVGVGTTNPRAKLHVNGGIKLGNDTDSPSASKAGTFRYYTSGNNSYVDMCMQTGASTYAWVNIVTNSW